MKPNTKVKATAERTTPAGIVNWNAKPISQTRQDVNAWRMAQNLYNQIPQKTYKLQLLFEDILKDALLSSQINNRKNQLFSAQFTLKKTNGDTDIENTKILQFGTFFRNISDAILNSIYFGYSVVEVNGTQVTPLPYTNICPADGFFYPDYTEDKGIEYRSMKEFGHFILEFNTGGIGLLNKAVPHVLFKRFAQSCWSELCEIYGIPPRVLKTNTQDKGALNRGEQMLRDMGAAAWFIIDKNEEFQFVTATATNGDVYNNLISLCNNELSLLVSGAVVGQDTKNGSRSKEQASQEMLWELVQSDMRLVEAHFNLTVLPALVKQGVIAKDLTFSFEPQEDLDQLWTITKEALPYYNVDPEWVKNKFGIEVTGIKEAQTQTKLNLGLNDFFA